MNIAIADDVIMFTMTRFNFSKLVCLVVKSAGTVPIPPKISSKRFQGRDGEFDLIFGGDGTPYFLTFGFFCK